MPDNDEELEATEDNITLEDSKHSISKYEASVDCGGSNESNMTELTTEESFQADKPKILIQRYICLCIYKTNHVLYFLYLVCIIAGMV